MESVDDVKESKSSIRQKFSRDVEMTEVELSRWYLKPLAKHEHLLVGTRIWPMYNESIILRKFDSPCHNYPWHCGRELPLTFGILSLNHIAKVK